MDDRLKIVAKSEKILKEYVIWLQYVESKYHDELHEGVTRAAGLSPLEKGVD